MQEKGSSKPWYQRPGPLAGVGIAILVVLFAVFLFSKHESIVSEGNKKQQGLIVFWNETTNVLSGCIIETKEAAGIAEAQTGAINKVISEAVRGRYEEPSTAQPGGGKNSLFSAMVEAYPNTDQLSKTFQDVLTVVTGCRTKFQHTQAELQKHVTMFNEWREGSFLNRKLGAENYPTDKLVIEVGKKKVSGQAALDKMRQLVVIKEANTGRETGEIEAVNPFGEKSAE